MTKNHQKLFIDGNWTESETGKNFDVINPATLEIVGTAAKGTREDTIKALESAQRAFLEWSKTTGEQRARLMDEAAEAVIESQEEIGRLLCAEHGKPLSDAMGEVKGSAKYLTYYAEEAKRIGGEVAPNKSANTRSLVIRQPRGVVAAIAPWNYPIALTMWKVAPALAAGCTVVAKPPADTPLAASLFLAKCAQAGLPAGVLNVVTGPSSEVGDELIINPISQIVAFTGSTETGKHIASRAAPGLKKLILELGGQTPLIVFKDADIERAVADGVKRSFRNMGQICNAVNRIYVEEEIADEFVEYFVQKTKTLTMGDGLADPNVNLGPMTNQEGIERTKLHIQDALEKGAKLLCGGHKPNLPGLQDGYFFEPTVLGNVSPDMLVMHEETFGPVVGIDTFKGVDEAITAANSTRYGLVSYVYTSNLHTAYNVMEGIQSGSVAVNTVSPDSLYAPYPAWKDSGIGLELARHGMEEYFQIKHCLIQL